MHKMIYMSALILLLIASLTDLIVPFIIGTKYPGYNHLIHTISTLGTNNSPVQKYECLNLIFVGILFILFAIAQYFLFEQKLWSHNWYTIGIIIFGIGCILAGIFPEDSHGVAETSSGKIHGIASGIGFLFLILNPLWAVWIKEFKNIQIINILLFALGLATFILFLATENNTKGFLRFTGLFQRLNLIVLYGALIVNFSKILKLIG